MHCSNKERIWWVCFTASSKAVSWCGHAEPFPEAVCCSAPLAGECCRPALRSPRSCLLQPHLAGECCGPALQPSFPSQNLACCTYALRPPKAVYCAAPACMRKQVSVAGLPCALPGAVCCTRPVRVSVTACSAPSQKLFAALVSGATLPCALSKAVCCVAASRAAPVRCALQKLFTALPLQVSVAPSRKLFAALPPCR